MTGADTPVAVGTPMTVTVRVGMKQAVYDPRLGGEIVRSGPFTARAGGRPWASTNPPDDEGPGQHAAGHPGRNAEDPPNDREVRTIAAPLT
jgi:hypothetical protein